MSTFNPQRIADLFLRFYNVLIDMTAFPQDHLRLPPHDPPINTVRCASFGMTSEIIDLLERFPYLRDPEGSHMGSEYAIAPEMLSVDFLPFVFMGKYQDNLHLARNPNDLSTAELQRIGHYIEPWSMVITKAQFRESSWIVLNTKFNTITEVNWSYGTAVADPMVSINKWCYDTQHGRPAEDVIEGWIQKYLDLEWVPGLYVGRVSEPLQSGIENLMMFSENKYEAIRDLYRSYGWPSNFRTEAFLSALATLKKEVEAKQIRDKDAKYPGYREHRLRRERLAREKEEIEREQD